MAFSAEKKISRYSALCRESIYPFFVSIWRVTLTHVSRTLKIHNFLLCNISVTARFATRFASKRATGFETGRPASKPADRITTFSSTPARFEAGQIFGKRVSTRFVAGRAKSSVDNTAGRSFVPWRKTLCYVVLEFFLSAIFHCYIRLAHESRSQHRRERVKRGVVVRMRSFNRTTR